MKELLGTTGYCISMGANGIGIISFMLRAVVVIV